MNLVRTTSLALVLAALTGCDSIGDGSTVQSLQIQVAATGESAGPFALNRCLRDQLVVVATFTNGTRADFSYRATWTSSDPAVVQVSNNDIPLVVASDGAFIDTAAFYRPGTLVPRAASGTATVTASFLGLTSSMDVQITTPAFKAAPVAPGVNPNAPPATVWMGSSTTQRFGFLAVLADGRSQTLADLNAVGNLNPLLWRFVGGVNDPAESGVTGDFDKYAVPNAETPDAVISADGVVTAKASGVTPAYTVEAVTSLCPDDSAFRPTANVRVAPFGNGPAGFPLTLAYDENFNGPGATPTGDLVAGSITSVRVTGHLDTDGDGAGDQTQDLSSQIDMNVTHATACTSGETNCTCDSDGSNCTKRLVFATGSLVQTLVNNDGANATLFACQNDTDTEHLDDCEELAAGEGNSRRSNALGIQVIPVVLTGADASIAIQPTAPAAQPALQYPGRQFDAYGTFKALSGAPFAGGTSDTGTQKLTAFGLWSARKAGSTTEFSTIGFMRSQTDGLWARPGSFASTRDVTENTNVDIHFETGNLFSAVPDAAPVTLTVCPSTGC